MRKNRIFKPDQPLKTIDNNPFYQQNSKFSVQSNLKSNAHFSIIDNLTLHDLIDNENRQSGYGELIRLSYISTNGQIHIDEEALYVLQKFTSSEISFVGIYGKKKSGKSLILDKILNLAGIEGSHYCRTSQNYQKGLYFYSLPFRKTNSELKVFLLDCVGFQLSTQQQNQASRQEDMLLDMMLILCSSIIVMPSPDDTKGQIFKMIYNRFTQSTERITQNKVKTTPQKEYWPKNVYCLLRSKQRVSTNYQDLQKLFLNYTYMIIHDAMPNAMQKMKGITNDDLVQIQAIPQNNMENLHLNGLYIKQASRLTRQIIQKVYNKKYYDLKYNGNICCKLLLTLIKHLNKKQRIKIDKIFYSILKQLYDSAYQYHLQFYDQKLQQYFLQDDAYPMDYLLIAFQSCQQSIVESFNQLTINEKMHEEYEKMLEKYINQKEELILEINKKKTRYQLKNKIKDEISFPENFSHKEQIFEFIEKLQHLEQELDHDRCTVMSTTLIDFANDLQNKYCQDAYRRQQIIIEDLQKRIQKRRLYLQKDREQNMKNIMINTQNQNKYQSFLKQNQSLDYKIKNTKKQIDIQRKFQKQFMANKQAAKQHAQRLLGYIRQLQQKSRDNQKVVDEINKQFDYNPTIEILNKRIQEKIRMQKELETNQSALSQKRFGRKSQMRTIVNGSNISGIRASSMIAK